MTTFTMWTFESPDGAGRAVRVLEQAASEGLVTIVDHAVASWPEGASKPDIGHGHENTWRGAGWGAFWGVLLGSLFLAPVLGAAAGAAIGGVSKHLEKVGLDENQLEQMRSNLRPGMSALFAVTDAGNLDRLGDRFHGWGGTLVETNLTAAERDLLLETFGDDDAALRRLRTGGSGF